MLCLTRKELGLETNNKEYFSLIIEKLNGEGTVLQNIRKSEKENLSAEMLYFLRFGSLRRYYFSLFLEFSGIGCLWLELSLTKSAMSSHSFQLIYWEVIRTSIQGLGSPSDGSEM
ncbi:hypothetical protein DITRI_Ditri13aG0114500 [Diplodiscus trichospermus]